MGNYLVTGGAGFIGSNLVDALVADGHTVRVLDDLSTGCRSNVSVDAELVVSSVTEAPAVRDALEEVDGCFHLAAIASVARAHREWAEAHRTNLSGTITVFEEAHRHQERRGRALPVVYASSAAVYGDPCEIPLSEASLTRPINAYGADKLGCELHAAVAAHVFDLKTVGMRFFNVYGPRQSPDSPYSGVVAAFCNRAIANLPPQIHGDGAQVRDFVYVKDAVRALKIAMEVAEHRHEVFNVCTGIGTSVRQLAETTACIAGTRQRPVHAASRIGDIRMSVGDPRKATEQLGFRAATSLEDGLSRTIDWIKSTSAIAVPVG